MPVSEGAEGGRQLPLLASSGTIKPYQYEPLPGEGWTRVLELHCGSGPLSGKLHCISIDEAASTYAALSYVWGDDSKVNTTDLQCDGQRLLIGTNLAQALGRIRHEKKSQLIWADAISINQADNDEKAHQVKKMGKIYANASQVLIWLGLDNLNEATECFELIEKTNEYLDGQLARHENVYTIPPISGLDDTICLDSKKWDLVRHLMDNPWFSRVWVLQEVGLARSAALLWGRASMEWVQLVELQLFIAARPDLGRLTGNTKSGTIWDVYEDVWSGFDNGITWRNDLPLTRSMNHLGNQSFIDILNDGRVYEATDQRDRIYAFLGHPRGVEQDLMVDYNATIDKVYLAAARSMLNTIRHPWTVLSAVDHILDSPSLAGTRPSWVPRWNELWRVYWLGYSGMWYRAGGANEEAFEVEALPSESYLRLNGVIFDSIAWTTEPLTTDQLTLVSQKKLQPIQKTFKALAQHVHLPPYADLEQAFSLAIVAGRAADEGPAEDHLDVHASVYSEYKDKVSSKERTGNSDMSASTTAADRPDGDNAGLDVLTYVSNQRRALHDRRVFLTSKGYIGVGHMTMERGDVCCVFRGANVPFVLRKVNDQHNDVSQGYRLVGECYVQGIMKGEVMAMLRDTTSGLKECNIVIA